MNALVTTPKPPYYVVIFSSVKSENDDGYSEMSARLLELVINQDGFLGVESARNEIGITVSYWESLDAIQKWKDNRVHKMARKKGREKWYDKFTVRIARVEREYGFNSE